MNETDPVIINNRIAAERREKLERLRDEFAMAALTGLMAPYWDVRSTYETSAELVKCQCESAYEYADEMLKARLK